jgi:hypothetical protein
LYRLAGAIETERIDALQKAALFVFNGDPMCFIHVLLNALDMDENGTEARIVIEGAATRLLPELEKPAHPLHTLWRQARDKGLVEGACRACAGKMKTAPAAEEQGIRLLDDMRGHPGMAGYRARGYEILTF